MTEFCTRLQNDGRAAAVWEKPATGDRMAPFDDPLAHWDLVRFHSDFQYLSRQDRYDRIAINHALVAGLTGSGYSAPGAGGGTGPIANGQFVTATDTLVTHSLGYVPLYQVLYQGNVISPGTLVQVTSDKARTRFVSAFATSSVIGLKSVSISSKDALPAVTREYDVIIFREPEQDPDLPMVRLSPHKGDLVLGKGRITAANLPLRRWVTGDTVAFYQPIERTLDIHNGAVRQINQSGAVDFGQYNGAFFTTDLIKITDQG